MNVLVAIDSSATAHAALAATLARTWPHGTQFRILTVLPPSKSTSSDRKHPRLKNAHRLIDRATALIEAENPSCIVVGHIDVGDPSAAILASAKSWPADLIVVGSHDRGPFERLIMGSVSRKVMDAAECSALVARNFDCFLNRVLIAFDNTVGASLAVSQVMETSWPADTQFHLLTVIDSAPIATMEPNAFTVNTQLDMYRRNLEDAEAMLQDIVAQLETAFGRNCASYSIAEGLAKYAILDTAKQWQADLIVLGSRGLTGLKARVFGSVSKDVATSAECSALITRTNVVELRREFEHIQTA